MSVRPGEPALCRDRTTLAATTIGVPGKSTRDVRASIAPTPGGEGLTGGVLNLNRTVVAGLGRDRPGEHACGLLVVVWLID